MNVYDFDNTIYKGDSTAQFYKFCLFRHPKILILSPSLLCAFFKYKHKTITKTEFKQTMFKFLTFINLDKDLKEFWQSHKKNIKDWYIQNKQADDVIISASPEFLLKPICDELGIKHLLGSPVDSKTGKYTGINCSEEEKVKRFYNLYNSATIENFYSDSYNDTPLAKIAIKSYLVKDEKMYDWDFK